LSVNVPPVGVPVTVTVWTSLTPPTGASVLASKACDLM
jgi:hypothetical protein